MDKVLLCGELVSRLLAEVPHVHIHLVPINGVSDINFEKPKIIFFRKMIEIAKD